MELLVLIAVVVGAWWWLTKKKAKPTAQKPIPSPAPSPSSGFAPAPEIQVTVTTSTGHYRGKGDPPADVGPLTQVGTQAWVLNPRAPLPLTLQGADEAVAREVKLVLERADPWHHQAPELALLVAKHNLTFKEVTDFVGQLLPAFEAHIRKRIDSSTEWSSASEKDKQDLLAEFRIEALELLGVDVGGADLVRLLRGPPAAFQADDELLHRFDKDIDLYPFYLTQLSRATPVASVKADDWDRKSWERLVAMGMALRGKDIPVERLLEGLRLKDLNQVLEGATPKPLGRKAKAIELLLTLPDLEERLSKRVAFRELFVAVAPAAVSLVDLQESFGYASEVASVVHQTYVTGAKTVETLDERKKDNGGGYNAWEVCSWRAPTPACAKPHCKKAKRLPAKLPPFHPGCNCELLNTFEDD